MPEDAKTRRRLLGNLEHGLRRRVAEMERAEIRRREVEEKLRRSEERLRLMTETTGDCLYQLRYDTMTYDYLSPGITILTGYTPREINELSFASLVLEVKTRDGRDLPRDYLRQRREAGQTREYWADYLIRTKDGATRWLGDHSFPWLEQGEPVGSVGILTDITERKRAEAEREALITRLEQALAQVTTLQGLLPICSHCKKIRDDDGYWQEVEQYISQHSSADFSHGVCPDCARKHYGDYYRGDQD